MRKIWAIIQHDLRVFLADRSNLPSLLLTPAVMTILIALVTGGAFSGKQILRLDVIDRDHTRASSQLLAAIRQANPDLTLCPQDNTSKDICDLGKSGALREGQALDRVAGSTSLALLEIPAGYQAGLQAQTPVTLIFRSAGSFTGAEPARQAVQAALSQINSASVASQLGLKGIERLQGQPLPAAQARQLKASLYQRALKMEEDKVVSVAYTLSGTSQQPSLGQSLQQGLGQSVPGMGTMFVMMTVFGGMAALIVERRQWTLQRLAVMPISRSTLLAGKILARFSLGLLQFLVVLIVGALLGMNFGQDPLALLLLVILYTLSVTAISFAIGSGLKNPTQASGLALLLSLTLAPLGGAWWPMEISPRFMQIIGHISPVAWAMDGFTALTYRQAHLAAIWVPLAVLLGMTVVAFLIAIPRFRYQLD